MKQCSKCGVWKPLSDFYRSPGMRDGYRNDCKPCNLAAKAERHRANPEPARARARQWQFDNPERFRETQRRLKAKPEYKRRERNRYLVKTYGITVDEYDALLAAQGGVCAICRCPPREDVSLHLDHDHATGERRGLLCFKCNNALGDFDDDPERLLRAYVYLTPSLWTFEGAGNR